MSSRLYDEFMKKLKVPMLQRNFLKTNKRGHDDFNKMANEELVICIPLKGGGGNKQVELDDNFVKVIQYEYAVRYLEKMGIEANPKNIARLLKTQPLSSCEFSPGWNSSGWLADMLYIYPNKLKKNSFD